MLVSVESAAEWETIPVEQGHDGLRSLAAEGFSGGVTDSRVWAMLTNGRVVGIVDGEVDDLVDADLTAHKAPDPALPLLAVMRERSTQPRAQYYTEETPLSDVDTTLREGGFTGYVELSENVLSGDYFIVYYGGERMPVAFIGGSERLETGEEAFDRAADEVGIYDIHAADISIVEVPGADRSASAVGMDTSVGTDGHKSADEPIDTSTDDSVGPGARDNEPRDTDADGDTEPAADGDADTTEGLTADDETDTIDESMANDPTSPPTGTVDTSEDAAASQTEETDATGAVNAGPEATAEGDADIEFTGDGSEDGEGGEENPASSPTETDVEAGAAAADAVSTAAGVDADADEHNRSPDAAAWTGNDDVVAAAERDEERLAALRAERDDLQERIEVLTHERDELQAEVMELQDRLATVERERDELRAELASDDNAESGPRMSAATALSGTNLFVRYRSRADPTLEEAIDGGAPREAVDENLRLERHTMFEAEGATIDGRPYDEFLPTTLQYRFVEWLVRALPFELRDAAIKRPLSRLYKVIPSFDRAEIDGTVAVRTDDGEDERSFDVVLRDRKGAPFAVASLFAGREPATEAMLSELVENAKAAAAANESLGAAVFVTTSYYAPEALELVEAEASNGGLFGRGLRESYVRLDRSHGFHLCLVEARDGDFHLGVPEL
jgi:hypothetical protein